MQKKSTQIERSFFIYNRKVFIGLELNYSLSMNNSILTLRIKLFCVVLIFVDKFMMRLSFQETLLLESINQSGRHSFVIFSCVTAISKHLSEIIFSVQFNKLLVFL